MPTVIAIWAFYAGNAGAGNTQKKLVCKKIIKNMPMFTAINYICLIQQEHSGTSLLMLF